MVDTLNNPVYTGKHREVQRDTEITPDLLAKWSQDAPLCLGAGAVNYALVSLLYEPMETLASWNNSEEALELYINLLINLYGRINGIPAVDTKSKMKLLKHYVEGFGLSKSMMEQDIEDRRTEHEEAIEEISEPESVSTEGRSRKTTPMTSKTTPMTSSRSTPMTSGLGEYGSKDKQKKRQENKQRVISENLIGRAYKVQRGRRIFVDITRDGRPMSVPYSTWQSYLPGVCTEQYREAWKVKYPNAPNKVKEKEWTMTKDMSYEEFDQKKVEKKLEVLCRLEKQSTLKKWAVLARVQKGEKLERNIIYIKDMPGHDWEKVKTEIMKAEEEDYKTPYYRPKETKTKTVKTRRHNTRGAKTRRKAKGKNSDYEETSDNEESSGDEVVSGDDSD